LSPERAELTACVGDVAPSAARVAQAAGGLPEALDRFVERRAGAALARGRAAGEHATLESAAAALQAAAERFAEAQDALTAELATSAVDLGVEIARCILRVEIPAARYDVAQLVRETLAHARTGRGRCTVHLHPADAARLAGIESRSGTSIEPDDGVARGSVHVETPQGLLVRDIDECLAAIEARLKGGAP
jgi:flagellar biosynthesis/type III secretory pathway protein FliH